MRSSRDKFNPNTSSGPEGASSHFLCGLAALRAFPTTSQRRPPLIRPTDSPACPARSSRGGATTPARSASPACSACHSRRAAQLPHHHANLGLPNAILALFSPLMHAIKYHQMSIVIRKQGDHVHTCILSILAVGGAARRRGPPRSWRPIEPVWAAVCGY